MPMLLEEKPDLREETIYTQEVIASRLGQEEKTAVDSKSQVHLKDFCREVPMVGIHTTCGEAAGMLNKDQAYPCIVLCDDQMHPLGLLMRETLYKILNGRFAADLFYHKPISRISDSSPVIVDVGMDALGIIDIALSRSEKQFYDCLILTEEHKVLGVLTMRDVMSLSRTLQHKAGEERTHTIINSRQEISGINDSISHLVQAARNAGEEAQQIMKWSEQGEKSLLQVEASYNRVHEHMEGQRQHAGEMLTSIETGAGMARSIRSLADQSGLLAMNASIEAAHAGEYGLGFQVVAGEIRALAKQTREIAGNMSTLLENIGELTQQTVELVRASSAEIVDSSVHVTAGGTAFKQLSTSVAGMSRIAEGIVTEGKKAGEMAEHINRKLQDMVTDS
ncbi:methyl-accepting chemotaxis protein [Paenibacillus pabuli]|uniref:methyl-accepting chemotaxis protein n=1 Tax=Paenibacillus pabuli TaxID=1472 RepID=UPI003CF03CE7